MKDFWRRLGRARRSGQAAAPPPERSVELSRPLYPWPPLRVGYATDQGRDREYNEDSLFHWSSLLRRSHDYLPVGLYIVADGMGGHENGESASELATRVVASRVLRDAYLPFLSSSEAEPSPLPLHEVLVSAVEAANEAIARELTGAGTTLTAAFVLGDTVFLVHVGDTRAYLLDQGRLQQLTADHSLVGRLLQVGAISEEEALHHPQRNIIYRSVGQGQNLEVDWYSLDVPPESSLLLCSDGLWGSVPDAQLLQLVSAAGEPQRACDELARVARAQGSVDDITVMLVERGRSDHERGA